MKDRLLRAIACAALAAALGATAARAQTPPSAQAPPAEAQSPLAPQSAAASKLTPGRLEQMLAPIALYPDDLLADILMAATYPLDVVEAARWAQDPRNASLKGDRLFEALKQEDWDPSAKALAPFPGVLRMMDANLGWTERLGEAFVADPEAVMDAVQRLRRRAQSAGRLVVTPQTIVRTEEAITIKPAIPAIVYVPVCDPSVVYGAWPYPAYPPVAFGADVGGCGWVSWPIVAPIWGFTRLDFRKHRIEIERDRFALLNHNRAPIGGEEWRHDPFHRGNVPYRDATIGGRFGVATPTPQIPPAVRGYLTGPLSRTTGPFVRAWSERALVPLTEGVRPLVTPPVPLLPRTNRPLVATWPERGLIPRTEGAERFVRAPVPPVVGSFGPGGEVGIPSGRRFSTHISTPALGPMGAGHYFSAPVGGLSRTPPTIRGGVQAAPFVGGVQAAPFVAGMRGR